MRAASRLRLPFATAVALIGLVCLLSSSASAGGSSGDNGYAQMALGDSPVAFWGLDETGGSTAADSSTTHLYDHAGTYVGIPSSGYAAETTPMGGNAVTLSNPDSGSNQRIDIGYDSADELAELNPSTYTLEAWVKPSELPITGGTNYQPYFKSILCSREADLSIMPGYHLYIGYYDGAARFAFLAGSNAASQGDWGAYSYVFDHNNAVVTGQWYHVVATNDGTNLHLYVNGQDVTGSQIGTDNTFPPNCQEATHIGACKIYGSDNVYLSRYSGSLADVAVYSSVLPLARIREHQRFGTEGPPPATNPSLELSSSSASLHTGRTVTFTVQAKNVSNVDWTKLSATVTGANARTISLVGNTGTSATFSYAGPNSGTDRVIVSGEITGDDGVSHHVDSNSPAVNWLAGMSSEEGLYGMPGTSPYTTPADTTWLDPVNSSTGNFYQSATDVSLPGTGIRFSFERTYNSRDEKLGRLGKGWSASVFASLSVDETGNVTLKAGNGQEIGFVLQPDGSFEGDKNVTAKLTKSGSGYDLVQKNQDVQHFDSSGRIVSWLDLNGQGLHYAYDGDRLTNVTDSGGRVIDFSYDSQGRLTQVTVPGGTTLSYAYDGDLLKFFTNQTHGVTTYVYDGNGFLKSVTDASGKLAFENTYDELGRVTTQKDALENESSFDWSSNTATDAQGGTWQDNYNDKRQLLTRTDALGQETHYVYDDANNLLSLTDPLGNTTTMTYDGRGDMLSRTDALGNTESWTYDSDNNVTSHTDQLGNVTSYTYDSKGNVLTETDPLGNVTSNEYDSAGRQLTVTDPLNRTTRSVYDDQGNLIETISPSGARTTYVYDAAGRLKSTVDPRGNEPGADPSKYTTSYEYDDTGRLVTTTDPLGHTTTSTYDAAGRLQAKTDANGHTTSYEYDELGRQVAVHHPDGSTTRSHYDKLDNLDSSTNGLGKTTTYEYDKLGRQTATISPSGERTETTYDANGNVTAVTDPLNHVTKTSYDALGRQIESEDPLGRITKTFYDEPGNVTKKIDPKEKETTYEYDKVGRQTKEIDPLNHETVSEYNKAGELTAKTDANRNTTHYAYDAGGREVSVTGPSGAVTTSAYDAAGNLIGSTDANSHTTTYTYDAAGDKTAETNPLRARTVYTYDPNGNQLSETNPLGHTSKTVYDKMNRETAQVDPLDRAAKTDYDLNGNVITKTDPLGNKTTSTYDADGRLASEIDPLEHSTVYSYDDAGRLVSKTDANGHTTGYAYDAAGEKVSVTAPGGSVTSYDYEANGNVVKRTDANGHATTYSYDAAGNKVSKTNPLGNRWTYFYDPSGNLTKTKTPSGGTITQAYDAENRPLRKSYSDATPTVSYTYDLVGNKLSMTDGISTTRYAYDAADQRLSSLNPAGGFLYTYDLNGNLLSRSYPNALETSYSYNDAGDMVAASVKGKTTLYSHDGNGNLVSALYPSGILDSRSYDAAGRLTTIRGTDSRGKLLYSRSYSYDPAGNPLTLKATAPREHSKGWWDDLSRGKRDEGHGHEAELARWSESYSYDSRNRLTRACMNAHCSHYYAYAYDPVGNRTSLQTSGSTTSYSYDAADELLSASEKKHHDHPELTSYGYDQNGNQTAEGSTHYSYNLDNKLTRVMDKHQQVSYSYTGDGLMNTRSSNSQTTSYAWDSSSDLPQLALETTRTGQGRSTRTDTTSYTYGEDPIGTLEGNDAVTFHTDSLGSVIALTDEHGKPIRSYRYSPYGGSYVSGRSGDAEADSLSSIRFAGQYLDSESDLYNMRAREYQPETGRFLQTDPLECDSGGACGSVYAYVEDQPTVKVDPSGEKGRMAYASTSVACSSVTSSNKKPGPNGCGPGGWMGKAVPDNIPWFIHFNSACDGHDRCYGNWNKNTKRSVCDRKFYSRMQTSCGPLYHCAPCMSLECGGPVQLGVSTPKSMWPWDWWHHHTEPCDFQYNVCMKFAKVYYTAVRKLGKPVFDNNQLAACPWKDNSRCKRNINGRDK
jgi:RHS repeat-associated protein